MSERKPAIILILITLFIDSMGWGIIIPVLPDLLEEITRGTTAEAAFQGGLLVAGYAIMQFVFGPIFGGLSDKYGRRPIVLASLFGFAVDYLASAVAPTIWWLFAARFFAGILGASFSTGGAYISDISTPETRAQNFGLIGVAFGLGFIAGPMIGGLLSGYGIRAPFYFCAGLTALNWLYAFFFLPESLKKENRREFDWKRANPFGTLGRLFSMPSIGFLFTSLVFVYLAAHAVQSNWGFYTKEKFAWGPKEIGISLAVVGVAFAIVQGGLIRVIIPKLGQSRSVYVGLSLYALGLVGYAFAVAPWMVYASTIVYCLGGIAGPALQGIMASSVAPNAQGELQGGFTSMASATSIIGPLMMNSFLFSYFTGDIRPFYFPGAAMFAGAVLCLIATIIARNGLKKSPPLTQSAPVPGATH